MSFPCSDPSHKSRRVERQYTYHTTDFLMKSYRLDRVWIIRAALAMGIKPERIRRTGRYVNRYKRSDIDRILEWTP